MCLVCLTGSYFRAPFKLWTKTAVFAYSEQQHHVGKYTTVSRRIETSVKTTKYSLLEKKKS